MSAERPPRTSQSSEEFEGRFLTPVLTWLCGDLRPGPGYALGTESQLYRNGELVGWVQKLVFDRAPGGFWVHYRSWRGSPLDMGRSS